MSKKVVPGLDCSARGAVSLTAAVERRPRVLPSQRASLPAIVLLWRRDVGLHVPVVEVPANGKQNMSENRLKFSLIFVHMHLYSGGVKSRNLATITSYFRDC